NRPYGSTHLLARGEIAAPHEHEARRHRDLRFRIAVLANQDHSLAAVGDHQYDRLAGPGADRLHADVQELADRLVEILQPKLRTDLGAGELEAELLRLRVDIRERHGPAAEAEVGRRHRDEVDVHPRRAETERRAPENLLGQVADPAAGSRQGVA